MSKFKLDKAFTSESVGEGHPDKMADQISDAILDFVLRQDPNAHVACETFCTSRRVIISGEISTIAKYNSDQLIQVVRDVIRNIGYSSKFQYDPEEINVEVLIHEQSEDIKRGVDQDKEIGAGDQGIMFGFAIDQSSNLMPYTIEIAHDINKEVAKLRKSGKFVEAGPDMKSQVTIGFQAKEDSKLPKKHYFIKTVLVSLQHIEGHNKANFEKTIKDVVDKVLIKHGFNASVGDYEMLINPTGKFVVGGPVGDTGLTGRKIIVDTYGGHAAHGGGAFSGKDSTKVDRSAAYLARYIAKNLVAAGINFRIQVQLSYAIGRAEPLSVYVDDFEESDYSKKYLETMVRKLFALKPKDMIERFGLKRPIYQQLASYGHFGRDDLNLPWEKTDMVKDIKKYITENKEVSSK